MHSTELWKRVNLNVIGVGGCIPTCPFVKIQAKVIGTGEVGYCCDDCRPSLMASSCICTELRKRANLNVALGWVGVFLSLPAS